MLHITKCQNCGHQSHTFFEEQAWRIAEEHMMETGHIVNIEESE
jgi:hypothetical protein